MYRYAFLAAICLLITPANAGEVDQFSAESISVGGFHGILYYTNEQDGYHVVSTISEGESGLPVRFEATITETQRLTISVPGKLGEQSQELEISRAGGKLVIAPSPSNYLAGVSQRSSE